MAVATFAVVGLPALLVAPVQSSLGLNPAVAILLAMALSVGASALGAAIWMRRPGSQDVVFADLMVWGWLRRVRAERRMTEAAELLGHGRLSAEAHAEVLEQLAAGLEARDPYTQGHSRRVARHSERIAARMGLSGDEVAKIRTAAAVHDVGKINTPRSILLKPGRLDDDEVETMRRHAADGERMVAPIGDADVAAFVRSHHERLDGSGYPDGLAGADVPLGARIIAVADTFDAMTSARTYRAAGSHKRALDTLASEAGSKLDARAVVAFRGYYSGGRAVAAGAFLVTAPSRVISWLGGTLGGGSVAPLAQGASAIGAAALLGGAMAGDAASPTGGDPARPAQTQQVAVSQPFPSAARSAGPGRATPRRGAARSAPGRSQPDGETTAPGGGSVDGDSPSSSQSPGSGSEPAPSRPTPPGPRVEGGAGVTAPPADAQVKLEVSLPQLPVELPKVELELNPVLEPVTDMLPLSGRP
jgi:hypothetical protein